MTTTGGSGEKFASTIHTFIEIVESPIVVQVFNNTMSLITVGPDWNLVINPMLFSYDPDVNVAAGETRVRFLYFILQIPILSSKLMLILIYNLPKYCTAQEWIVLRYVIE